MVGDSAAGKTTLTRGIVRILGSHGVSFISGDDYHRYGRRQRAEMEITPLDPAASHLDIIRQHLEHLRRREAILKPVYDHRSGTLGAPEYVRPSPYVVVEGLLGSTPSSSATPTTSASSSRPPRSCGGPGS